MYSCSKCHKTITDRTVSVCDNRFWHSTCLNCQICGHTPATMSGPGERISLYAYRGSLICKNDYMRMNFICKSCSRPITQSDMVIRTKNFGYLHDKCVFCKYCSSKLHTGDRYFWTVENAIVCHKCMSSIPPNAISTAVSCPPPGAAGGGGHQMHGTSNIKQDHNTSNTMMVGPNMGPPLPSASHMMGNGPNGVQPGMGRMHQVGGSGHQTPPNAYMSGNNCMPHSNGMPNNIKMESNGYGGNNGTNMGNGMMHTHHGGGGGPMGHHQHQQHGHYAPPPSSSLQQQHPNMAHHHHGMGGGGAGGNGGVLSQHGIPPTPPPSAPPATANTTTTSTGGGGGRRGRKKQQQQSNTAQQNTNAL